MRIIAGEQKGRVLKAPKGDKTRPTTDRVRESMMSAVASECGGFEGLQVLDAFAGSGALGLEALSRGAAGAVFFEHSREAQAVLQGNVNLLGYSRARARICRFDVLKTPPLSFRPPFDLVFLDPPYSYNPAEVFGMVASLKSAEALSAKATVVYEYAFSSEKMLHLCAEECGFVCFRHKKYGETGVSFFHVV